MIILLPQILLHHVISKSVPITESYSKTIGLPRRNGSTIESPRKRKCLKKRRLQVGVKSYKQNKQTTKTKRIQWLRGWGFEMKGGNLKEKKNQTCLSFLHFHTEIGSLT